MSSSAERVMAGVIGVWLLVAGAFLFVKGLDISLVACAEDACAAFDRLSPGIASFVVGVGMLFAWESVVAEPRERGWMARLGIALVSGAVVAAVLTRPVLAVADRLGIPLWLCVALVSAVVIPPYREAYGEAIVARAIAAVPIAVGVVAAEVHLEGDAYIAVFCLCAAATPPSFALMDRLARRRAQAPRTEHDDASGRPQHAA
ncbi:MAG: hypothetical protein ACRDLB_11665 [Actinomycetota bacterium]